METESGPIVATRREIRERERRANIDIQFDWTAEPRQFGGFTPPQLESLVHTTARFFNIPPPDQERMHLTFGDHTSSLYQNGTEEAGVDRTFPYFNPDGSVHSTYIVINRSRELLEKEHSWENARREVKAPVETTDYGTTTLQLIHPWEGVVWRVAEEMHHAATQMKLGSETAIDKAKENFRETAQRHHKDKDFVFDYTTDLLEVAASRQVLRYLIHYAKEHAPEREVVYRQALEDSLTQKTVVLPDMDDIKDRLYIPTGYVEKQLLDR